jgi:hypothetical protein
VRVMWWEQGCEDSQGSVMVAVGEAFLSSLTCVELADRAMISRLHTGIQIQSPSDTMQFSSRIACASI